MYVWNTITYVQSLSIPWHQKACASTFDYSLARLVRTTCLVRLHMNVFRPPMRCCYIPMSQFKRLKQQESNFNLPSICLASH